MEATRHPTASVVPSRVPEAYIRAEIATWPLTSLTAFASGVTELDPLLEFRRARRPTFRLWRACEENLAQHASGWSLDRLVSVRDFSWFAVERDARERRRPVPMHQYLRHLADVHIDPAHGTAELRHDRGVSAIDVIYHYYWLTFAIPEDMLLAAVPIVPPPRQISMGPSLFARRLSDHGIAEIHQHAGAGLEFPLVWAAALAALADPDLREDVMASPGAPFRDGVLFARWLLVAASARVVLGEFLLSLQGTAPRRHGSTLRDFLHAHIGRRDTHARRTLSASLRALARTPDGDPPCFEALHAMYIQLFPAGIPIAREPPRCLDEVWRCDPLAVRLGLAEYGDGERWLVRHGLAYLDRSYANRGEVDADFAAVFWQVQRLRCLFYRYIVERPLTAGLQWFIRFYNRIGNLSAPLREVQAEANFRVASGAGRFAGVNAVGALEIRVSAPDDPIALAEKMSGVLASWQRVLKRRDTQHLGNDAEIGVVINFAKHRDADQLWGTGGPRPFGEGTHAQPQSYSAPRQADPSLDARLARFDGVFTQLAPAAWSVADLVCAVPESLWLVRGIDVCSDELAVPTWVLVPFYRYLRQASQFASALRIDGAPPLGATAHVGEDYRHLMEGLRRIYESCQYLLGRSGGRLGHATALGVDPRAWAESAAPMLVPAEDRLWDLVFEWRMYSDPRIPPEFMATAPPGRQERLGNLIMEEARELWRSHDLTPRDLADLHERLHTFMLPARGRAMQRSDLDRAIERGQHRFIQFGGVYERLRQQLQDPDCFRRGQQLRDVSIDASEIEGMLAVQSALRRGIASRGIVVEVNPTSNLLIGNLLDLRHHPLLRLCPVEPSEGTPPVPIAIGSDDPIVFCTSLLHEYELMQITARGAGYPDLTVAEWLERIRKTAFDARFTLPWRPRASEMAHRLMRALESYSHAPSSRGSYAERRRNV